MFLLHLIAIFLLYSDIKLDVSSRERYHTFLFEQDVFLKPTLNDEKLILLPLRQKPTKHKFKIL